MDALLTTPRSRLAAPRQLLRLRSDAALGERFAEGDEAAFSILFERHRASVVAVCIGVLGSRHDAEDAAQETFAALAVALRSSPPRELRAWLTRVARNAAIDLARRRRTRESVNGELSDVGGPDGVSASQIVKDELESVIAGIRELPESQRTALLMRELAGHSYREIADLLESDEDAVRGLIARARVGLRQYREAVELPCATARAAIAAEPDGRRHGRTIRRHVRGCASCRAYRSALRDDARVLRGLLPVQAGGAAGGSAVVGIAAKGALLGTAATQVTAACAVSACAVGGIALIAPAALTTHHRVARAVVVHRSHIRQPPHSRHPAVMPAARRPAATGSFGHRPVPPVTSSPGRSTSSLASSTASSHVSHRSVTAAGRYTVPANGSPHSTPRHASQSGSGSGSGSGRSSGGGSQPGGSRASSLAPTGQQTSGTMPRGTYAPLGGTGPGDRGQAMFSGAGPAQGAQMPANFQRSPGGPQSGSPGGPESGSPGGATGG